MSGNPEGKRICEWECTWKHLDCLNSGMWGQMQIRPNFQNFHKRWYNEIIFSTKANNQIFTRKTISFLVFCLFKLRKSGKVECYILLYVVCHCVICVAECGAYMGSKNHMHELHTVHIATWTRRWRNHPTWLSGINLTIWTLNITSWA